MRPDDESEGGSRAAATWAGGAGALLLLLALIRASTIDRWDAFCALLIIAGTLCCGFWAVTFRSELSSGARTRRARFGRQAVASSVFLVALLVMVNFIAARHNARLDLTEAGLFTLAPQTKRVLHALPRNVRMIAFFPSSGRAQAADLLRRYAEGSRHLSYELIDPDADPDMAQKYGVTAYGTVVVEVERRPGEKKAPPIRIEPDSSGQQPLSLSEEKLTNALLKVVRTGSKTIYFLEGHGEGDINSPEMNGYQRVGAALQDQAFVVKPLFLARSPAVPADCAALIIAGPASEPLPDEMSAIERYLETGGRVLALVDPAPGAGLAKFLDSWGITEGKDLVVDASGAGRMYGAGPAMPLVKDYNPDHPVTHDFRLMTFFPLARSLTPKDLPGDAMAVPLAQSGAESFAEPYNGGDRHAQFQPGRDKRGPIVLATAVTRETNSGKQARVVAIGSSNFISNAFFDKAGNGDLFLNAVNWLAEEDQLIAIRPKPRQDHRIELTEEEVRGLFWLTVIVMPGAALIAGGVVAWRRR